MENSESQINTGWDFSRLASTYLFLLLLVASWFFPPTKILWQYIDEKFALTVNSLLRNSYPWQKHFWAFLSKPQAHWIYDVVIFALLIPYVIAAETRRSALIRFASLIAIALWAALMTYFFNRFCAWKILHIMRDSPSVVFPDFFYLSDVIHWTFVKVASHQSFPSDHGTTFWIFTIFLFHFRGKFWGCIGILLAFPFAFSRFIVGAHWITDYVLGSLPLVLFHSGWLLACPYFLTDSKEETCKQLSPKGESF